MECGILDRVGCVGRSEEIKAEENIQSSEEHNLKGIHVYSRAWSDRPRVILFSVCIFDM
jgi:hypothetical protein